MRQNRLDRAPQSELANLQGLQTGLGCASRVREIATKRNDTFSYPSQGSTGSRDSYPGTKRSKANSQIAPGRSVAWSGFFPNAACPAMVLCLESTLGFRRAAAPPRRLGLGKWAPPLQRHL